jgi:DNA-binding NarL/FixJ family response regulator
VPSRALQGIRVEGRVRIRFSFLRYPVACCREVQWPGSPQGNKKRKRKLPVLILSMYPEENYAACAIKGGAQGYLTKGSASDELLQAVRKILSGKKYISPAFASIILPSEVRKRHQSSSL